MLKEAIESVLAQSLKELEVLVVDDCSTDGTEEFVKSIHDERVHYFRNESNSGSEASRNLGLRNAKGKYITFLDDDDYFTDYDFFSKTAETFAKHNTQNSPLAFVCAQDIVLETSTGVKTLYSPGNPGRVKGVDFVLNKQKIYTKCSLSFSDIYALCTLRRYIHTSWNNRHI